MKITIEHRKKKYECVHCGPDCSFSKVDGHDMLDYGWHRTHCAKGCYLPRWWIDEGIDRALKEVK